MSVDMSVKCYTHVRRIALQRAMNMSDNVIQGHRKWRESIGLIGHIKLPRHSGTERVFLV